MKQQAICELCMQAFEKRSANQKYCTECGVEMRKQQHAITINQIHLKKNARKSICIISDTAHTTATENIRHSKGLEKFKEDKEND